MSGMHIMMSEKFYSRQSIGLCPSSKISSSAGVNEAQIAYFSKLQRENVKYQPLQYGYHDKSGHFLAERATAAAGSSGMDTSRMHQIYENWNRYARLKRNLAS